MESTQLKLISEKLQELASVMSAIIPLEHIKVHPLDHFTSATGEILKVLDNVLESVKQEKSTIEEELRRSVATLRQMQGDLELEDEEIPELCNLFMTKEYLRNELSRALLMRKNVEAEICLVVDDIAEIADDLGAQDELKHVMSVRNREPSIEVREIERAEEKVAYGGEVSVGRLKELRLLRERLRKEREEREMSRDRMYRDTLSYLERLNGADAAVAADQKIFILERLHERYRELVEDRQREFDQLVKEIRRREECMEMERREIPEYLDSENIASVREYNASLKEEQKRHLEEIYNRTYETLKGVAGLFGCEMGEYERSEDGIEQMRAEIEALEAKKELFMSICSLIDRRRELLERMSEFEKIASDPRRLFKSSFQLLSEEKFRNSAFPSLIKIEESLFSLLAEYEERFGVFVRDSVRYREALKNEIDNRIVNKTVFISKFDSPMKKRK
jgi:hypothetical protein